MVASKAVDLFTLVFLQASLELANDLFTLLILGSVLPAGHGAQIEGDILLERRTAFLTAKFGMSDRVRQAVAAKPLVRADVPIPECP